MGLFVNNPPNLAKAPDEYSASFMNQFTNSLRIFFDKMNAVQNINVATLNLDLNQLPTEANVATLRSGDVYRDSSAANVLKVKV